mmetsp:Transcript_45372/g.75368  ORF Transcript_45372/g.75368 Transcript_45372/m.75368 type:complete len:239 (+) Transcript_45372:2-718(+)
MSMLCQKLNGRSKQNNFTAKAEFSNHAKTVAHPFFSNFAISSMISASFSSSASSSLVSSSHSLSFTSCRSSNCFLSSFNLFLAFFSPCSMSFICWRSFSFSSSMRFSSAFLRSFSNFLISHSSSGFAVFSSQPPASLVLSVVGASNSPRIMAATREPPVSPPPAPRGFHAEPAAALTASPAGNPFFLGFEPAGLGEAGLSSYEPAGCGFQPAAYSNACVFVRAPAPVSSCRPSMFSGL